MGVSVGWADVYDEKLIVQSLDVSDLMGAPAQWYTLVMTTNPDGDIHDVKYSIPWKGMSLHLGSTATLQTLTGQQLWLHSPMHQGLLTRGPCWLSMPSQQRSSTKSVLPLHGVLVGNLATQLERYRVGKPSLFSSEKCLSLHVLILTQATKSGNAHLTVPFFPPAP